MNIEIIPVTAFQQNCALVWNKQKQAVILDPGGEADKLIKRIEELELDLQQILLTHGHLDHVGVAVELKAHFNVQILGPHRADDYWLKRLPEQSRQFGFTEIQPFEPDRWLNENDVIETAGFRFEILHLPGHTPGHIGFIEHQQKVAFTGDVLFNQGVGRTDFPYSSHSDLLDSIKNKMYLLPDDMLVLPGHGAYTSIGQEKQHNPFVK